ncbi:snake venom serine protease BPA-like [Venturia canescens]|uniref:snake venom serine protease BPA-like n=1 Tax=Venturia canescens TaxID=32260 RepID=UPI001C9BDF1E|nr:snake venom serine protease BPA-like [Venturia canescens]
MPKYLLLILLLLNMKEFQGSLLRGTRVRNGQFPWLIQFHTISPCGGVLITPDWVLTAAQCVQYKRNSIELYATGLNGTGSNQTVSVKATYIYPQFRGYSKFRDYDNNIALLKLVKAFDMCDPKIRLLHIAPMRLDEDYKSCLIFGWQSTVAPSSKVHAKPIQYSQVLLNSWRVCLYMHEGNASFKNVFCTMVEDDNGIRACAGNPGSPVVCEDQYQRMILLGIASWSNYSLECGGLPTYLGVSIFRSWMGDLIFGNKDTEEWESGMGSSTRACDRNIHIDDDMQLPRIRNSTDQGLKRKQFIHSDSEEPEDTAYDLSWKSNKHNPFTSESKRKVDDYSKISDLEDSRIVQNFDVVRVREKELSQYREIGKMDPYHFESTMDKHIAVPSEHKNIARVNHKSLKVNYDRNIVRGPGNLDDIELIMPDGIDDFQTSYSSTSVLRNGHFQILYTIYFVAIVDILI